MKHFFGIDLQPEAANSGINDIPVDIFESDDEYMVLADCPGMTQDDIKLKWAGDALKIKLPSRDIVPDDFFVVKKGRNWDEAERLISFEEPVDKQSVTATLKEGLLRVIIKKQSDEDVSIPVNID